jgi:DNA invertase Pin-like site-specific DNA recombinase
MMSTNRRAFAYLRVSGRGQLDGDGFPRQRTTIQGYADMNGFRIIRWFREEGVSGTKDLGNRPALQALLIALHADGVKIVLIERLDRLARDLMVQETIIGDLRKHGFELISVAEPDLCSDDPSRKLVRQVFGAIAEYERAQIVLKLRGARIRMRLREGRCEGRLPFGTKPGEENVIARMRQLQGQGLNVAKITELINSEFKPRTGKRFYPANVARILRKNVALDSKTPPPRAPAFS